HVSPEDAGKKHSFPGFIKAVKDSDKYRQRFKEVFGTDEPTADTVAKSLATYMRTILSGNSVFDRAEAKREGAEWKSLKRGYELFTGEARCVICHPVNGLFTDHDFHNIGLDSDDLNEGMDKEGRIRFAPVGLKDKRLSGAYRTPSLRALPRTGPYMHDGRLAS